MVPPNGGTALEAVHDRIIHDNFYVLEENPSLLFDLSYLESDIGFDVAITFNKHIDNFNFKIDIQGMIDMFDDNNIN